MMHHHQLCWADWLNQQNHTNDMVLASDFMGLVQHILFGEPWQVDHALCCVKAPVTQHTQLPEGSPPPAGEDRSNIKIQNIHHDDTEF